MLQLVGVDAYLQTMQKFGVTTLSDKYAYGLSLALGSGEEKLLEHTAAFSVLANGGTKYDTTPILKVEDSKGEILSEVKEATGKRVADEKDVYMVNWMLCDLGGFGDRPFVQMYNINGKKICGKTGTTDGPKDLIAVLYHTNLVVSVWNGNNNNKEMPGAWATTVPLTTANSFIKRVADNYQPGVYNRPSGVLATTVCTDTGATPQEGVDCKKEASIYISGRAPQVDKRETVVICKEEKVIPSNLDAAEKYGLTTTKVLLSTKLENSLQENAYKKYLTSIKDSAYIFDKPGTGACALPLGPNNAPLIDMASPSSNSSVGRGKNLEISGQVSYLESISSFVVQFDGSNIPDASVNADGTFVVNYFIPLTTTVGAHTVTVKATDNKGKSDTETISINVTNGDAISLVIANPSANATIAFPLTLVASVSGGSVDSVSFEVTKVGGGYSKTFTDSDGSNGYSYVWNDNSGGNGSYQISVKATKDSAVINGNTITVSY
jgi:hypothetical protein